MINVTDPRDVLIAPVISEKSYGLLDENKYTFLVAPDANKTEIKIAVEKVFGVRVLRVNTLNRNGKSLRNRFGTGKRSDTKRAIVQVAPGDRIDIFGARLSPRRTRKALSGAAAARAVFLDEHQQPDEAGAESDEQHADP